MKKFFAILMTICLMASVFSATAIPASAYNPDTVVMSLSGMTENGSKILTERYENFESGWNDAARWAKDHTWMEQSGIVCIVVDLHADWVAEKGKFGKDNVGFKESTIYIPENTKMMINMQGHTIDRGLTKPEDHGEVIFMGKNSTLIINGGYINDEIVEVGKSELNKDKMGTITGGYSDSGAGGIHLDGYNNLTLNNVNIVGNGTKGERGAGIALFNDSTLTMNGGSISNNHLHCYQIPLVGVWEPLGSLYLKNSTATLNNVELCDNYFIGGLYERGAGLAISATNDSNVTMKNCLVSGNGETDSDVKEFIYAKDSTLDITDTDFIDNKTIQTTNLEYSTCLFYLENSEVYLTGGKITGNTPEMLFNIKKSLAEMRAVTLADNASWVMNVDNNEGQAVKMINCTLGNNEYAGKKHSKESVDIKVNKKNILEFDGGDLGDTTFNDKSMVAGVGSIFGEGSLTMVVALAALVVAIAAMGICITSNKKKAAPTKAE